MFGLKRILIVLAAVGAVCGGVAAIYGPTIARNTVPQFYIARGAANTAEEFLPALEALLIILPEMVGQSLRHEMNLGVSRIEGDLIAGIDPTILTALPIFSLRNVMRWDNVNEAYEAQLVLQMAATPVITANMNLNRDRISVNVPMLFDYYITMDPQNLQNELNESILSEFGVWMIDDRFYQVYSDLLFAPRVEINMEGFLASLPTLITGLEFEYVERLVIDGVGERVDMFSMVVPAQQANNSLRFLLEDLYLPEDLPVNLFLYDDRLVMMDFDSSEINGQMWFPGDGLVQFELEYDGVNLAGEVTVRNREINAEFDVVVNEDISAGVNGSVRLFPDAPRLEAEFGRLSINLPDVNLAVNARYLLSPEDGSVIFDYNNARLLTDLHIFDLLEMFTRIDDTPLGGIVGNLLP